MNTTTIIDASTIDNDERAGLVKALGYAGWLAGQGYDYRTSLNSALFSLTWEWDSLTYPGRIAKVALAAIATAAGHGPDALMSLPGRSLAEVFERAAGLLETSGCAA